MNNVGFLNIEQPFWRISALFYSCHWIYSFTGSRAGYGRAIYIYICIYFWWWLVTVGSASSKGRLRLDGVMLWLGPCLSVSVIGSVATGTPAHHPTFWSVYGDVGIKLSGVMMCDGVWWIGAIVFGPFDICLIYGSLQVLSWLLNVLVKPKSDTGT